MMQALKDVVIEHSHNNGRSLSTQSFTCAFTAVNSCNNVAAVW